MNDIDLGRHSPSAVWEEHVHAEFVLKDADAILRTMVAEPYVFCIPSGMCAKGRAEVREFYARHFLPNIPSDLKLMPLSRATGSDRLVEEFVVRFTHSIRMDWILPDLPPTGRKAEFVLVAVIGFRHGKVSHEHIHWDHAALLGQLGFIDQPFAHAGVTSAARLLKLCDGFGVC
ncbi:MAG: nuclear transport factor 2 family protein [Alphaproteobacteria bacterium]|nr:nuclear transport factor 2 family protein [Alphaproteobacteria bacterium]MBV8410931.1 nuclear transport factor 2 family protein [Alphaproteobacteria bacterium]